MRIAMLTYSVKPRGGVVHALNLAEALQGLGHNVHVYSLAKKKNSSFFRPLSVKHTIFDYIPDNRDYPTLEDKVVANVKRMIEKYIETLPGDFDVYHTQDCIGAVALSRLMKEGLKAPTVRTIHHIDIFNEYRLQKFQEESISNCDIKLVVSKFWQQFVRKHYGISAEITYNGVDTSRFAGANGDKVRAEYGVVGKPLILFIGGLEPRKGLEYLIMAMERIIRNYPKTVLLAVARAGLVERGEDAWFRMLVERLKLEPSVRLIDYIKEEDVPSYYAAADVYTMPSRMEGWGIGLMEAMAAGKPVVATRTGGIPELVVHGRSGLLVESGDITALSDAIITLLGSEDTRKRLGREGNKIIKKYTWESTAKKMVEIYKGAMKKKRC